jgi:hypothetical protein
MTPDMNTYVAESRARSGVPRRVKDEAVFLEVAQRVLPLLVGPERDDGPE